MVGLPVMSLDVASAVVAAVIPEIAGDPADDGMVLEVIRADRSVRGNDPDHVAFD
jgi:hypothetical protein